MSYIYQQPLAPVRISTAMPQMHAPKQIPLESLPDGTVLEVMVGMIPHEGILQRWWYGSLLVHHNSKRHGGAVTTSFSVFSEGRPVRVLHIPQTAEESHQITQSARNDVARGIPWTVGDNCQDLVSRAVEGKNGSRTRDAVVVGGLFGLALWLVSR